MARPSKLHSSSDEALSNASSSSDEEEQVNEQINEEEDEEELEAVARPASSADDDDEVAGDNPPDSDEDPAADDADDDQVKVSSQSYNIVRTSLLDFVLGFILYCFFAHAWVAIEIRDCYSVFEVVFTCLVCPWKCGVCWRERVWEATCSRINLFLFGSRI